MSRYNGYALAALLRSPALSLKKNIVNRVKPSDLYSQALTYPHITIAREVPPTALLTAIGLLPLTPITVTFGKVMLLGENLKKHSLAIEVHCPEFIACNEAICTQTGTKEHFAYQPHFTLCEIKASQSSKYASIEEDRLALVDTSWGIAGFGLFDPNGKLVPIHVFGFDRDINQYLLTGAATC